MLNAFCNSKYNSNYMFLSFIRIIKFSFQDVFRNIWLSVTTITILILALLSVNILLIVTFISKTAIKAIEQKIDINLYLSADADENQINSLKDKIKQLNQTLEVYYISKTEALESFKKQNQNKPEILQALRELGKNPLTPILVIKPNNLESFDELINKLNQIKSEIIESRNFTDYKIILNKINNITNKVSEIGILISFIFVFITLLVVFNTIRVSIYTHRKEISIMRLVGASNFFIYTPFLLSVIIYALMGVILTIIIFYPFLSLLQSYLETFFINYNINIITYFNDNFLKIFGLQSLGMIIINVLASLMAIRKYVRV